MKYLLLLLAPALWGQTPQLSFGSVTKGELSATVEIKLGGSGSGIAGAQFSIPSVAAPATATVTIGPAGTTAAKSLSCATNATRQMCLLFGLNANLLQDGVVALVTLTAPSQQTVNLALSDLLGAALDGSAVIVTAGAALPVSIGSKCDLNADGKTDIVDVTGAVGQALGIAACVSADITGRGKCDLLDVQRVVNAAVSGVCKVGPQ